MPISVAIAQLHPYPHIFFIGLVAFPAQGFVGLGEKGGDLASCDSIVLIGMDPKYLFGEGKILKSLSIILALGCVVGLRRVDLGLKDMVVCGFLLRSLLVEERGTIDGCRN